MIIENEQEKKHIVNLLTLVNKGKFSDIGVTEWVACQNAIQFFFNLIKLDKSKPVEAEPKKKSKAKAKKVI